MEAQQRLEIFSVKLPQHQPRGPHRQSRSKRDLHNAMLQPTHGSPTVFRKPVSPWADTTLGGASSQRCRTQDWRIGAALGSGGQMSGADPLTGHSGNDPSAQKEKVH
jgi:hypothetical protein